MKKSCNMESRENLYKLIRLGLYSTSDIDLPKDIDWKYLIASSLEQGVCAIAVNEVVWLII